MTRMPFGRTLFRYSSVTRWIARVGVLQLFLVGQRRLVAERHLAAEPRLAVAVDLDHLDQHVVALGEDVVDGADPRVGDLGDVEQPLGVGNDLHEGAELDDLLHLPEVDPVQLHLATDVLDDGQGLLYGRIVGREHGHAAIVLDVDLGAGLLLDAADDLAAGADDLADLLGPDLDRDEAWRIRRELRPWLVDHLAHLGEDDHARLARL